MEDKISIIVPVYNVEDYLQRCVDSLTNQTYKNIEIILVDDGSKDRSGEICDYYAQEDARIKVIHQKNGGQSKARNEAMKIATGDYFCFVDSDDYVSEELVEKLHNSCVAERADIAFCDYAYFSSENVHAADIASSNNNIERYSNTELIKNMHTVAGEYYVVMWAKLFKRHLLEGITFPEGKICEDLAVLYRIYDKAEKTVCISDKLYYYFRNNVNSSTYAINARFYDDVFSALSDEIEYMKEYHSDMAVYPMKTYMYWAFDYYSKLRLKKNRNNKIIMKQLLKKYRELYKTSKSLKKETFYTCFYYMPNVYLSVKNR